MGGSAGPAGNGGQSGSGFAAGRGGSAGTAGKSSAGASGSGPLSIPEGWLCGSFYGDDLCDCGCGVIDIDCPDHTTTPCSRCGVDSCSPFFCPGNLNPEDNARCTKPPPSWECDDALWNDATCDCGCGYPDPGCPSLAVSVCDSCNARGSCSVPACPGTIDPELNALCHQLTPPADWTCDESAYGDGDGCDCGCGAVDLDCVSSDLESCQRCYTCGGGTCAQEIDPEDTTRCLPTPAGWICEAFRYRDGSGDCHCGCGVFDPDCESNDPGFCSSCPEEGCTGGDCSLLDPTLNALCNFDVPREWTCNPLFYDDNDNACDCGCGIVDPDCASAARSACDVCNPDGGCSTTTCPGTIDETDNSACVEQP